MCGQSINHNFLTILRRTIISKKLIYLVCFVLVLSVAGNASTDMIAHWTLDEGSGSISHDKSGNGHDGTIGETPNWVARQIGGALGFDSSTDYIDVDTEIGGTFSVALWVMPRNTPYSNGYRSVMAHDSWSAGSVHVHLLSGSSAISFDSNGGTDIQTSFGLTADQWYHIAY